jgi:hypothetical protein
MTVQIYRCTYCGREVLVRPPGPLSPPEIARRVEEEFRVAATGPRGRMNPQFRLRDDIWAGISSTRTDVPRREIPEFCPACGREQTLGEARTLD